MGGRGRPTKWDKWYSAARWTRIRRHQRAVRCVYDVLEDGAVVGRIFLSPVAPADKPWMWASGHKPAKRGPRLQADARGCDGGVCQELAAGIGPPRR